MKPMTWMMYPSGRLVQITGRNPEKKVNKLLEVYPDIYAEFIFFQAYFVLSTEGIE